jgi:hypothetical protein
MVDDPHSNSARRPPSPPRRISPWPQLGLTSNPFRRLNGLEQVEGLLELDSPGDREPIRRWLSDDADVVQFVGQEGWGKSTRLRACHYVAAEEMNKTSRFDYVDPEVHRISVPRTTEPLLWFIDEAQRLNSRSRRRIGRWAAEGNGRLFLGTHVDIAAHLKPMGLKVRTIRLSPADEPTVRRFVDRRLALLAHRGSECRLSVTDDAVARLSQHIHGDLSRAERILYEACQRATENCAAGRVTIDAALVESAIQAVSSS